MYETLALRSFTKDLAAHERRGHLAFKLNQDFHVIKSDIQALYEELFKISDAIQNLIDFTLREFTRASVKLRSSIPVQKAITLNWMSPPLEPIPQHIIDKIYVLIKEKEPIEISLRKTYRLKPQTWKALSFLGTREKELDPFLKLSSSYLKQELKRQSFSSVSKKMGNSEPKQWVLPESVFRGKRPRLGHILKLLFHFK